MTIVIVAAEFHKDIIEEMIKAAQQEILSQGKKVEVKRVAGCYEIPLIAKKALALKDTKAVVALGYIEKGETKHGEVMGQVVYKTLVNIQLEYGKPVGIGIIGPGATEEQAKVRATRMAQQAVKAALQNLSLLNEISG